MILIILIKVMLIWVGISLLSIPFFRVFFSLGRTLVIFPMGSRWPIVSRLKNVGPGTPNEF